jgi:hypothetical protein
MGQPHRRPRIEYIEGRQYQSSLVLLCLQHRLNVFIGHSVSQAPQTRHLVASLHEFVTVEAVFLVGVTQWLPVV